MARKYSLLIIVFLILLQAFSFAMADSYIQWKHVDNAIKQPLTQQAGDPVKGERWVIARDKGNCLACHKMPIEDESFHGTVGPSLYGVATRLSEAELRLRIVDSQSINPISIMPGYYRDPKKINLIANDYAATTILTAQQVEDVVAYLMTLKQ